MNRPGHQEALPGSGAGPAIIDCLPPPPKSRLTQIDAFFVAYQQASGILMQMAAEVELEGRVAPDRLADVLDKVLQRCPALGQTIGRPIFGLVWQGRPRVADILQRAPQNASLQEWANRPLDPFREPPFQVLWALSARNCRLLFRAHHAVADGQFFAALCAEALRLLARLSSGSPPPPEGNCKLGTLQRDFGLRPCRLARLPDMWRHTRRLAREARLKRSARLAVRSLHKGDVATCRRRTALVPGQAWRCAAAWVRAIHTFNRLGRPDSPSLISLEVPVSLRKKGFEGVLGNLISPLVLFADACQPLPELALSLKRQFRQQVGRCSHWGVPLLTAPGRYLPWPLFRRMALSPSSTGFATSHFAWLDQGADLQREIEELSGGKLRLVSQSIITPVCLKMGAALSALAWPQGVDFFISYRMTALHPEDAEKLADLLLAELEMGFHAEAQSERKKRLKRGEKA